LIDKSFTYALKNGKLININQVGSGMSCGCLCPACGGSLIARRGKYKSYFIHDKNRKCEIGNEVAIQMIAKKIIDKYGFIEIPKLEWKIDEYQSRMPKVIKEEQKISIHTTKLGNPFNTDCVCVIADTEIGEMIIEICTKRNNNNGNQIKYGNISVLKIDISKVVPLTMEEFENILIKDVTRKEWIYNCEINKALEQILEISEFKDVVIRGFAWHIDDCPLNKRIYKGKSYANMIDDCDNCEYCVGINNGVICAGKKKITEYKDLSIDEDIRIAREQRKIKEKQEKTIKNGRCLYCNNRLVERVSRRDGKKFWGCSCYPHCRFKLEYEQYTPPVFIKNNYDIPYVKEKFKHEDSQQKRFETKEISNTDFVKKEKTDLQYNQLTIFDYI
jgi:ssDNA-binding Zn-finger/Zn-ribbon topoisomerase 1